MLNGIKSILSTVNWASLIRDLFSSLGFHGVWVNQGAGNVNTFIYAIEQRLTDIFIHNWRARLEESTKARFYRSFDIFRFQVYLEKVNVD